MSIRPPWTRIGRRRGILELHKIETVGCALSRRSQVVAAGTDAEFAALEHGWRRLTMSTAPAPGRGQIAVYFPPSQAALRSRRSRPCGGRPRGCGPHIRGSAGRPERISGEASRGKTIQGTLPGKRPPASHRAVRRRPVSRRQRSRAGRIVAGEPVGRAVRRELTQDFASAHSGGRRG